MGCGGPCGDRRGEGFKPKEEKVGTRNKKEVTCAKARDAQSGCEGSYGGILGPAARQPVRPTVPRQGLDSMTLRFFPTPAIP